MEQPHLPDELDSRRGAVNVVLFSRHGCPFCAIVRKNYLAPLHAEQRPRLRVVEVELDGNRRLRDARGTLVEHAAFGRTLNVRFAPTVMFLGADGQELSAPIVGLSADYFGAYLDAAIAASLIAAR